MSKIYKIFFRLFLKSPFKKQFTSGYLRKWYLKLYRVNVGLHSYGCFDPARFDPNVSIGRYCSFANTSKIMSRNHPHEHMSMHPYFYNKRLGYVQEDQVDYSPCVVEDDVWVGHNASILPNVSYIGRGAVIAAGAVVTKNVPRYAIVMGSPAVVKGYRFSDEKIIEIEKSEWWLREPSEIGIDEIKNYASNIK